MAFDQTHVIPSDLRPLNVVRNVVDDPRIVALPAATVGGRPPVVHREIGSPDSVPVFVHGLGYTTAEVAGVVPWGPPPPPRVAMPVGATAAFGYGYSPNPHTFATGPAPAAAPAWVGAGDSSGVGTTVASVGHGLSPRSRVVSGEEVASVGHGLSPRSRVVSGEEGASVGHGLSPRSRAVSGEEGSGPGPGPGKKVKFLCSFGGKILPRPSDGALRYVGGHTRIVSLRKDITFTELAQKMAETYGQSQPVYIKYQLPEEDLDALVSVSSPDDLENMMEEYEKLLSSDGDGSVKLRVFLFSQSDLDSSGMFDFGDLNDPNAQRYVEAVNGIVDFGKESLPSVNSIHSDLSGGDGAAATLLKQNSGNNMSDDMSPGMGPVRAPVVKSGNGSGGGVPRTSSPCPEPPGGVEIPAPPPPFAQADYVQQVQPQMGFSGPQLVGFHGAHQFVPTTVSPHVGIRQNAVQPIVDERVYAPRVVAVPMEQSYAPYQVQVPVPSAVVGGNYGWHHQAPSPERVIYSDGLASHQPVTYSDGILKPDCYMCQKSLPHAHSDSVVQQISAGTPLPESVPVYNSLRLDDHSRSQPMARVMVESGFVQNPEAKIEKERINTTQQLADHSIEHHPRVSAPGTALHGAVGGQYLVSPDALDGAFRVIPAQTSERPTQESPTVISRYEDSFKNCIPADQMRPIESRIESLGLGPTETSTEPVLVPTSRLVEAYEVAQPPMWGNPVLYAQPKVEPLPLDSNEVRSKTGDGQDCSNSLFSNQDPWNLNQDNNSSNNNNIQFQPPKPVKSPTKKEPVVVIPNDPFGENLFSNGPELNTVEDGIQQPLDVLSTQDLGSELSQSSKGAGSAEEQIRNDLKSVAEGVATSVFQSSSNPDLHDDRKDLATETPQTEDAKTKIPERGHMGFPVSGGSRNLQIIKNSDLEELRELGSGTFGTVYHGKWRGTDVAIKRINDRCFAGKPSEQERMRQDFWNEAIKLADLHHPNVLAFYGVVLDGPGGSVATVTEYMVNGSLRNALQKNEKSLDKRKRLLIAMDVAFGMEYLHGKNIVHFDLKSDNLLVNLRDPHRPICKVGDLGLSKVKCQTLISGGVRGTLPWMAPELLNGSSSLVSEKVDVFSFGIVMWELITGEEPYADLHYGAIIGGIVSNTLRPAVPESCDSEWRALMERCWSSEPSERPSFTEIANQLRSLAAKIPPKGQNSNSPAPQQISSPSA